jgi:hypothetical protein
LGLSHDLGSIEVGKGADLLLLKENPLTNVSAYASIETIFSRRANRSRTIARARLAKPTQKRPPMKMLGDFAIICIVRDSTPIFGGHMRKIRYAVAMSLDGYIAGPNGEYDWIGADAGY